MKPRPKRKHYGLVEVTPVAVAMNCSDGEGVVVCSGAVATACDRTRVRRRGRDQPAKVDALELALPRNCASSCLTPFLLVMAPLVAMQNVHTFVPLGSALSSGSRVRFPMSSTLFRYIAVGATAGLPVVPHIAGANNYQTTPAG
jgi:hypothetical protein